MSEDKKLSLPKALDLINCDRMDKMAERERDQWNDHECATLLEWGANRIRELTEWRPRNTPPTETGWYLVREHRNGERRVNIEAYNVDSKRWSRDGRWFVSKWLPLPDD